VGPPRATYPEDLEEEMEEGRKKIAELQCDLLELRDVHAKLRTSNEKLRREVSGREDYFDIRTLKVIIH